MRALALTALLAIAAGPYQVHAAETHPEVAIVVNGMSTVSRAIGEYYRVRRGIPAANVLVVDVPLTDQTLSTNLHESISREDFVAKVRNPLLGLLRARHLLPTVHILVTTKGLPLRVRGKTGASPEILRDEAGAALEAELAVLGTGQDGSAGVEDARNPYFRSEESFAQFRARAPEAALRFLVARLDGWQTRIDPETGVPADVKALVDRGGDTASGGTFLVDEHPGLATGLDAANRAWLAPTAALLGVLGVPLRHDRVAAMAHDAADVAGYATWGSNDPAHAPAPYYGVRLLRDGSRVRIPGAFSAGAIVLELVSTNARTFVSPARYGQSLVADLVHLGVAGAAGHVAEPALVAVARPQVLLPAVARGIPVAEAYFRSLPFLSWQNVWVGDPLLRRAPLSATPAADADGDGVPDAHDDCTEIPDPAQRDTDGDGYGNPCDPDLDQDGLVTTRWEDGARAGRYGDLERLTLARNALTYDPDADLDGDGRVDGADAARAQLWLFQAPGPSGRRPISARPADAEPSVRQPPATRGSDAPLVR